MSEDSEKTMTVMTKTGYTPPEQYQGKGRQGPWTDVYSMCATIYFCITGKAPADSIQRMFYDDLESPQEAGAKISPAAEQVMLKGLALKPEERVCRHFF